MTQSSPGENRTFAGVIAGVVVALVLVGSAGGAIHGTPTRISVASTVARCSDAPFKAFVNAEVEPSLAVSPANGANLIVVYQQDRYADGAARAIVSASSHDGGRTWRHSVLPVGFCARSILPGPSRTTDPWVSIGPDGRAYALASNVAVSSADGGDTWGNPVALAEPSDRFLLDKGSVTADPTRAGEAYAVWARYLRTAHGPPTESDAMFAKTIDGGRTWSKPMAIAIHGLRAGPIASQIVVDRRRGLLYHLAFWQAGAVPKTDGSSRLVQQTSTNGGRTWTKPVTISSVETVALATRDPGSGAGVRSGFVVPAFALNPQSGGLVAAWQDSRFSGGRYDQIVISYQNGPGRRWSVPALIGEVGTQSLIPTVAVSRSGAIGLGFYAMPARRRASARVHYEFAMLGANGLHLRSIGRAFALKHAPLLTGNEEAAAPPGLFLGDYMGIKAVADTFHLAYVIANPDTSNRTDVFYAKVHD